VYPVTDPLILRKSRTAANRTQDLRVCSQELLNTRPQKRSVYSTYSNYSTSIVLLQYLYSTSFFKTNHGLTN
jgi:hypothetical protein